MSEQSKNATVAILVTMGIIAMVVVAVLGLRAIA